MPACPSDVASKTWRCAPVNAYTQPVLLCATISNGSSGAASKPDRAILFVVDYHEIEAPQHVANLFVRAQNFRRHRHRLTSRVVARARATLRRLAYPRWLHREGRPFNPGSGSPLMFLRVPSAPPESPAIPLCPAYLRSFAGVSHRRDLCPTSTNPPLDSSTASPTLNRPSPRKKSPSPSPTARRATSPKASLAWRSPKASRRHWPSARWPWRSRGNSPISPTK